MEEKLAVAVAANQRAVDQEVAKEMLLLRICVPIQPDENEGAMSHTSGGRSATSHLAKSSLLLLRQRYLHTTTTLKLMSVNHFYMRADTKFYVFFYEGGFDFDSIISVFKFF